MAGTVLTEAVTVDLKFKYLPRLNPDFHVQRHNHCGIGPTVVYKPLSRLDNDAYMFCFVEWLVGPGELAASPRAKTILGSYAYASFHSMLG